MKRRIHTTIATLVAIVAISALVVPTASAERTKPGNSGQTKAEQCANLKLMADLAYESAREALLAGDMEHYWLMKDASRAYTRSARNLGCSWAKQVYLVSPVQTSSGPTLISPSLNLP
jgi:hypothetical protein